MIRIAHISDLHFGRTAPELLDPLLDALNADETDLVAVTGDLTQRARTGQFRAARGFLDRIEAPWLAVPGNHDVPLDNPWLRLLRPYARYRRHISADLAPRTQIGTLTVQGFNTVDPLRWQRGKVRRRDLDAACAAFEGAPGPRLAMAHHPFEQAPDTPKRLMKHAAPSLEALARCGADIVLSGHLHRWRAEPFLTREAGRRVLQVHVGTGLSTRLRGQENDFARLAIDGDQIELTRMVAREGAFRPESVTVFRKGLSGWTGV
ncbi:metallophosphoesterase family protein [Rhodovulum kholense]|uniref:3',5'-cyclic AMP phosphodiesterase CpdA n=1 Tax=Rhodovulum kholense TaxID=453584 RepID=A0A8E2VKZ8_9RHOB|nr:metallophosphoesterase [Rhodovulum kholense]PTW50827.1 3',5'-cyclic AMP phosphodiesterase CpdA [Rhodovulum kholense]